MLRKGAQAAAASNEKTAARVARLEAAGVRPTLAVVRVGERPDDLSYEKGVMNRCSKLGIQVQLDAHAPVGALLDQRRKVRVGQRLGAVLRGGVAQGQAERSGQSGARGQRQRQREGEQETKALHRYIKPPLP